MAAFKSGFIAILGRPNVGKSSIMNRLIGEKVAIVSDHPQTTRSKLMGVANGDGWQIVFVDTPGIHKPRTKLGDYMMRTVEEAKDGVDAVLCVADARHVGEGDMAVFRTALDMGIPSFLAVNKIDLTPPYKLMPELDKLNPLSFTAVVPVSARTGKGLDRLLELLLGAMPEGPQYFPEDMMTDQPERVLCAEIIREKALWNLRDEVPHGIGVEMMSIEKLSDALTEIHATVYCERAAHKSIIIGKHGAMLQKIGTEARADIEKMMGTHVLLHLWVKVREGWRDRAGDLAALGYRDE